MIHWFQHVSQHCWVRSSCCMAWGIVGRSMHAEGHICKQGSRQLSSSVLPFLQKYLGASCWILLAIIFQVVYRFIGGNSGAAIVYYLTRVCFQSIIVACNEHSRQIWFQRLIVTLFWDFKIQGLLSSRVYLSLVGLCPKDSSSAIF